jgi:hypothetical protein
MADNAVTISDLPTLAAPNANTVLVVNHTVSNVVNTYQLSTNNFFSNVAANVTLVNTAVLSANTFVLRNNQTPANSTVTVTKGTIMFDSSYLYIAVANNSLKRVALSSF